MVGIPLNHWTVGGPLQVIIPLPIPAQYLLSQAHYHRIFSISVKCCPDHMKHLWVKCSQIQIVQRRILKVITILCTHRPYPRRCRARFPTPPDTLSRTLISPRYHHPRLSIRPFLATHRLRGIILLVPGLRTRLAADSLFKIDHSNVMNVCRAL